MAHQFTAIQMQCLRSPVYTVAPRQLDCCRPQFIGNPRFLRASTPPFRKPLPHSIGADTAGSFSCIRHGAQHYQLSRPFSRTLPENSRITTKTAEKELEVALLLVNSLTAVFDASKYRDSYREKLDALIKAKLEAQPRAPGQQRRPAPVVNILDALRRSLEISAGKSAVDQ